MKKFDFVNYATQFFFVFLNGIISTHSIVVMFTKITLLANNFNNKTFAKHGIQFCHM